MVSLSVWPRVVGDCASMVPINSWVRLVHGSWHNCQYRMICDTYRTIRDTYCTIHIVSCEKSSVWYRRILSAHKSYDTVCVSYESYRIVKLYVSYDT